MKVFGKGGGAYDSDYMAAIEDAMILGCDSANLSLGSGNPGYSRQSDAKYQAILEAVVNSGMVVAMSAGNSGHWFENTPYTYPYAESVSWATNGSPAPTPTLWALPPWITLAPPATILSSPAPRCSTTTPPRLPSSP